MLNPDEWPATKMTTYEFYDCRRLRLNSLIALLVMAREMSIAMLPWAKWVGFPSSIESMLCGRQVVESSGFDQLQSIYKRHCLLDRYPDTNFLQTAPKSTELNRRLALLVVTDIYNFD
jgi:hypothetical protein